MAKSANILGLNSRSLSYLKPLNKKRGRRIADSKYLTKKYLAKAGLPVPKLIKVFKTPQQVMSFPWATFQDNFVLKPASGYGGEGIVIVKKRAKYAGEWLQMNDQIINVSDLRLRALDILAGQYSLHNLPDWVMVEERIKIAKVFKKYAFQGTPDIRVIVFNKVPVAAMLRLPTPESRGKANLHLGAIGAGIDLATGITTYGIKTFGITSCQYIRYIPLTKRKINGLKLPNWKKILTLAARCQEAVPSLGYLGVDIVFDKKHGPVILELNTRPGLWIQSANQLPLKRRLDRVEGLEVRDADHGVRVAQTLFAARFADRVTATEGVKIVNVLEEIKVLNERKKRLPVLAKIDTGAWRSSIDKELAREMGLLTPENEIYTRRYRSATGKRIERKVIGLTFYLKGRRIKTSANVTHRSHLNTPFLVGINDLAGFLVRPEPAESAISKKD
jgi:alpha-L-glutamate ligase-like protein